MHRSAIAAFVLLITATLPALAASAGQIKRMEGDVRIVRGNQTVTARPGLDIQSKDRVVTGANGAVGFTTPDQAMFSLGPNSQMVIDEYAFNKSSQEGNIAVRFLRGTFSVVSGLIGKAAPERTKFSTPTATIGIRGTEFTVSVEVPPETDAKPPAPTSN